MIKKRVSKEELAKISTLIKSGKSLNYISKQLSKSKTTIYYYYRKFKGKTYLPIVLKSNNQDLLGEFIGLFAGDGCLYKMPGYQHKLSLHFNITEKEYTNVLINSVLVTLFGKKPMESKQENRLIIYYYSKFLFDMIHNYLDWDKNNRKTYSVHLKNYNHNISFFKGFLRGCIDSDGYMTKNKTEFSTVSKLLANDISYGLTLLNLEHKINCYHDKRINRKPIYHIYVLNKEVKKFIEQIQPRNKKVRS